MHIFINEISLHGQYYSINTFQNSIINIYDIIISIRNSISNYNIYIDYNIFHRNAFNSFSFIRSLNKLNDKIFKSTILTLLYDRVNIISWRDIQAHDIQDKFLWKKVYVTDTSVAEISERKIQNKNLKNALLNFNNSKLSNEEFIKINKNNSIIVKINCISDIQSLNNILEKYYSLSLYRYDINSTDTPKDRQTILRDKVRFNKSHYRIDGRIVYKDSNEFYWCVDNLHYGISAHLEVFNKMGEHFAESDLNGNIDTYKRDKSKRLILS